MGKQALTLYVGTMAMIIATALVIAGQDMMSTLAWLRELEKLVSAMYQ